MKAVVSFFLACLMLVGSLIPQNDLSELSKLPQLLEHYRYHHSAAGGGLSLAEFLAEHYGAGEKAHFGCTCSPRHQQDHQGLPLHGQHTCDGHIAFLLLAPTPFSGRQATALLARAYRPAAPAPCPEAPAPALLQPPRA
ncbi:hypothetical protein A0257_03010 [Hymenobacter psoromatis]|nr:hypothetical protein A0257_03010 [Hymenobacter psoromatis]